MKTTSLLRFFVSARLMEHGQTPKRCERRKSGSLRTARVKSLGLALALAAVAEASAVAGSFTTDFSTDPGGLPLGAARVENGILKLQDLDDLSPNLGGMGTASLPQHGSYTFAELDPG